tara:strand:- start:7938 stop:11000 length:3063 start_codon:yes stop_codon:yes gene_type:complete
MSITSRKLAPGAISTREGLPSVFIERVKILPTDHDSDQQEVQLTLSLQSRVSARDIISGKYMVFVAFAHNRGSIDRLCASESLTKALIRNPRIGAGIQREYLKTDKNSKNMSSLPLDVSSKRRTLYTKELVCNYKCPAKGLKDLYVYAVPYRTDTQTTSKSGVDRKIQAMKIGIPVTETILSFGSAPLTTAVNTLKEDSSRYGKKGQVWAGPVYHYAPERQLYASTNVGSWNWNAPHPKLDQKMISNQKIVDMRFLNDIRRLSFSVTEDRLKLLSSRQRKDMEKVRKVIKPAGKISDISYTRTSDNSVKAIFSIDYDRLARENTRLSGFIQNKASLASCLQIENIRVFRTRVDPIDTQSNMLTRGKSGVQGSDSTLGTEEFVGSLASGDVKPLGFRSSPSGIRTFVINDDALADVSIGAYEYKIIVEMVDMSSAAAQRISQELKRFLSDYNKFLASVDGKGQKGFNIKARMRRESTMLAARHESWKKLINAYLTAIEFIYGGAAFVNTSSLMWRKNLIAMANPINADIKDVRQVYEIVNNFNNNLQKVYAAAAVGSSDAAFSVRSKIAGDSSARRKIALQHVFPSKYKPTKSALEGTDYLNNDRTTNNEGNLTNISFAEYEFRIADEMTKFEVPRPNAPGINKYGFLSPWRLNTEGSVVDVSKKMIPEEAGNGILNSRLSPNTSVMSLVKSNAYEGVYEEEVNNLLGLSDVLMHKSRRSLREQLAIPEKVKEEKTTGVGQYINSPVIEKDLATVQTSVSGSQIQKIKLMKPRKKAIKKNKITRRIISARAFNFRKLPRPIYGSAGLGSLAIASIEQEEGATENNSNFGNSINFNSLMEIQYFDGYRSVNGKLNLNAPIWRTLNQVKFNEFKREDEVVLCRMRSVTKAFKVPSYYHLPEYDSLFVLSQTEAPETTVNYAVGTYADALDQIYSTLKEESKKVALNIEDVNAAINPAYTTTPGRLSIKQITVRRGRREGRPAWQGSGWNWRRNQVAKQARENPGRATTGRRQRRMSRRRGEDY